MPHDDILSDAERIDDAEENDGPDHQEGMRLSEALDLSRVVIEEMADDERRWMADDAKEMAAFLKRENPGEFGIYKKELKQEYGVNLNDFSSAIKVFETKRRAERATKKIKSLAESDVPHFWRADQTEVAEKLCEAFVEKTGEPPAYEFGKLYVYEPQKGVWEEQSDNALSAKIQTWAGRALVGEPTEDGCKTLRVNSTDTAIKLAKARPCLWGQGEGWLAEAPKGVAFSDRFLLAVCDNGKWRVKECDKGPENRARFGFDFQIQKTQECPLFMRFVHQLFDGAEDAESRRHLLQEQAGASLFGVAPEFGRALILYGPGGCGKSTYFKILTAAFPPGAVSAVQPQHWGEGPSLADLATSRINLVSEISVRDLNDINAVKAVITGDLVKAEPKYQNPFSFRPDCGHIFTANVDRLPAVPDADPPFWERWQIVPFENKFRGSEDEDRTLDKTIIEQELPGVLAWIAEGARRLFEQGCYTRCPSGEGVFEKWQGGANNVALFYEECTVQLEVVDVKSSLPLITDVYEKYKTWAKITNHRACSRSTFGERTKALGLHVNSGGKRARCQIKTSFQDELESREQRTRGLF